MGVPKALLPATSDQYGDTILDCWWKALKRSEPVKILSHMLLIINMFVHTKPVEDVLVYCVVLIVHISSRQQFREVYLVTNAAK